MYAARLQAEKATSSQVYKQARLQVAKATGGGPSYRQPGYRCWPRLPGGQGYRWWPSYRWLRLRAARTTGSQRYPWWPRPQAVSLQATEATGKLQAANAPGGYGYRQQQK